MPPGARGRPWAPRGIGNTMAGRHGLRMLSGSVIHHFLVTGLSAVVFILLLKSLIGPHLPAGGQKLIASI